MSKTIKELADELRVSKTAVRKYMTQEFREQYTDIGPTNIIKIDDTGCKIIAESLRKQPERTENKVPETSENRELLEELAFLREQLQSKDRQIEAQQDQINNLTTALENTTSSLKAAQALHAGTLQTQLLPETKKPWYKKIFG